MAGPRSQRHLREVQGVDSSGQGIDGAPVFSGGPIADQTGTVSVAVTPLDVSGEFTSNSVQDLKFAAGGLPKGLTMDSVTGIISGTVGIGQEGMKFACLTSAKDGFGVAYSNAFAWTIDP
ncbi:MAG: hypothetical protein DRI46_12435 [Chloroflexi bacterium]|nr:MAG: hypothetical protein DRI46_12435 [Chloroflexota bacterium]